MCTYLFFNLLHHFFLVEAFRNFFSYLCYSKVARNRIIMTSIQYFHLVFASCYYFHTSIFPSHITWSPSMVSFDARRLIDLFSLISIFGGSIAKSNKEQLLLSPEIDSSSDNFYRKRHIISSMEYNIAYM